MDGSSEAKPPRVRVVRQGCRVAQADADAALLASGAVACAPGEADAVVVSTCAVTADAESAAFQAVRRVAREHPGVPVVVCGCLGALRREELGRMPGVAAVLAPGEVAATARALTRAAGARAGTCAPGGPRPLGARARPVLKVQDGCDARCAYCVVPLARGPSRSMDRDEVLRSVADLGAVADEVVLAGVHLGAYGADRAGDAASGGLSALVGAIAERGLVRRLRLSSVEPLEFPLDVLRGPSPRTLCASFHVPLQSGSDPVLRAMRRPYSAAAAASVVDEIARSAPGAFISADVMAGFPGETASDHLATLELVRSLPLAALHVFTFSPRPGTPAAALAHRVPRELARARAAELRELSDARWRAAVDGLCGREVEAVVERVAQGEARGTTREGVLARWPIEGGPPPVRGRVARLRAAARDGDAVLCVRA